MNYPDPIPASVLEEIEQIPGTVERSLTPTADLQRVQLILFLIPWVGFVPAIWNLYRTAPSTSDRLSRDGISRDEISHSGISHSGISHSGISHRGQRRTREVAKLAVTSGGVWAMALILLSLGQATGEGTGVSLLVLSSLLTSGYFLTNVWLMIQVLRRQRIYVLGLSEMGHKMMDPLMDHRRKHRP